MLCLRNWMPKLVLLGTAALLSLSAAAAGGATQDAATHLPQVAQLWLAQTVRSSLPPGSESADLRIEVQVGALDTRLKLAPCAQTEVFAPVGVRLWGATRVGVRCLQGLARWSVTLPATVKAYGPAWVVKSQVAAGAVLTQDNVVETEVDWAQEPAAVLRDPAGWVGQVATRVLSTGQTLRQGMVKPAQVFQAGAVVRVLVQGAGFSVAADGQALSAGVLGQLARVRMDSGRITSGVVVDGRTVRIDL